MYANLLGFVICLVAIQNLYGQQDIQDGTWYRTETNTREMFGEKYLDSSFEVFKFNGYTDSLVCDSLFRKLIDPDAGELRYKLKYKWSIDNSGNLILANSKNSILYKPLVRDSSFNFNRICLAKTHGAWRVSTNWTIISANGYVYQSTYSGIYLGDQIESERVEEVLRRKSLPLPGLRCKKEDLLKLKYLTQALPVKEIKNLVTRLSDCDQNNYHLKIFHDEGVFSFDGMKGPEGVQDIIEFLDDYIKTQKPN